ncbi:MAG: hypothetical protein AAGC95_09880 [Pseudomonadota bacterium]
MARPKTPKPIMGIDFFIKPMVFAFSPLLRMPFYLWHTILRCGKTRIAFRVFERVFQKIIYTFEAAALHKGCISGAKTVRSSDSPNYPLLSVKGGWKGA